MLKYIFWSFYLVFFTSICKVGSVLICQMKEKATLRAPGCSRVNGRRQGWQLGVGWVVVDPRHTPRPHGYLNEKPVLHSGSQAGTVLLPRHSWMGRRKPVYWPHWVKTKDAAKPHTMHRTVPPQIFPPTHTTKNYLASKWEYSPVWETVA